MLDDLIRELRDLRQRIDEHHDALCQSEMLTRYALIDPLLRALGWDTADPAQVVPEYKSGGGKADYALLHNGSAAVMLEAKKLKTPLQESVVVQGISYCLIEGTKHFSVSNGQRWEIYETHKPGPLDDKRIVRFDLMDDPARVCLQALALWRPTVEVGAVAAAQAPVLAHDQPPEPPNEEQPPTDRYEWHRVSEWAPQAGTGHPTEVLFPDESTAETTSWASFLVETVRWLVDRGHLNGSHCPVQLPKGKTFRIALSPVHPNGNTFHNITHISPYYSDKYGNSK